MRALIVVAAVLVAGCEARITAQTTSTPSTPTAAPTVSPTTPPNSVELHKDYEGRVYRVCDGLVAIYVYDGNRAGGVVAVPNVTACGEAK